MLSNDQIFVISGVADNDINKSKIDVTQYLSSAPIYEEFEVPNTWSDGREFVQKGTAGLVIVFLN